MIVAPQRETLCRFCFAQDLRKLHFLRSEHRLRKPTAGRLRIVLVTYEQSDCAQERNKQNQDEYQCIGNVIDQFRCQEGKLQAARENRNVLPVSG
jgi:hypothetical protein